MNYTLPLQLSQGQNHTHRLPPLPHVPKTPHPQTALLLV